MLPLKRVERPEATGKRDAYRFDIGDCPHNVDIGHIFGWIIILIDRQNAAVIRILFVELQEIGWIVSEHDLAGDTHMGKVNGIIRTR